MIYNLEDTICAQSTPPGRGGIHVIRVSGRESVSISKKIIPALQKIGFLESHRAYYGYVIDPSSKALIDEVMVTYFKAGKSFTTEDTIEISCHGNPLLVKLILDLLITHGCRLAERGEFTYRAYKGGRLSLAQAEAVLSLIDSNTVVSASRSLELLSGDNLRLLKTVEDELIWVISRLEARIDFSAEDIEIEKDSVLIDKLKNVIVTLNKTVENYRKQSVLNKGLKTIIIGPPNAGKSSLFNYFVGSNRSIVSSEAGTTRDYLSEFINIRGLSFELIDTAGLRYDAQEIEKQGILKVNELVDKSDLVLVLLNPENFDTSFLDILNEKWKNKKIIPIVNKSDLFSEKELKARLSQLNIVNHNLKDFLTISVTEEKGFEELFDRMANLAADFESYDQPEIINMRQAEAMEAAAKELSEGIKALSISLGDEFVLSHLNRALKSLFAITFIDNDEVIRDKIFKDFCLGK